MKKAYRRPSLSKSSVTMQAVTAVCTITNPSECIE
jgi:hypothetical protein